MSNITKLEFVALDKLGKYYLAWALDAEIHLNAMNLIETIKEWHEASLQDHVKVMIFFRHYLHEVLKAEYLTIKDPYILCQNLAERYGHHKPIM